MGRRGPDKVYDVRWFISMTKSQDDFLHAMAVLMGVGKQEVLRHMIDTAFIYSIAGSVPAELLVEEQPAPKRKKRSKKKHKKAGG